MTKDTLESFSNKINSKFLFDYDLKKSNWFNIGGKAKVYFKPDTLDDLVLFLKRFGESNQSHLSFPIPGWTLAMDIPSNTPGLNDALNILDDKVTLAGGRIYLAKDARQSSKVFTRSYPRLEEWRKVQKGLDPDGIFNSDLATRIGLLQKD